MASTYLSRTGIGSSNNQKKWTFSVWLKKCLNGSEQRVLTSSDNSSYDDNIRFESSDQLRIKFNNGTVLLTNRLFRDNNAYYHIVVKVDTDQASANDRIVLYINGVDERTVGGYATSTMPNQGTTGYINYNAFYIGVTNPTANSNHFNGIMSHVHFTDGYAYTPTSFGETDSTTGEWKIKTSPSVSYGTTGFWILKDGNSVTDSSSNTNNFTVAHGTLTKTEDNPSNVFNVWNMNARLNSTLYIDYGATQAYSDNANWRSLTGTLGASSGKFYYEAMPVSHDYSVHGWVSDNLINPTTDGSFAFSQLYSYGYKTYSGVVVSQEDAGGGSTSYGVNVNPNDVLGCAIDIDNSKAYWSVNGVWLNSADPANGTNGYSIQSGQTYVPAISIRSSGGNPTARCNFGNGAFGNVQLTGTTYQANGLGIFKYQPPTGFTALCTKGLNL